MLTSMSVFAFLHVVSACVVLFDRTYFKVGLIPYTFYAIIFCFLLVCMWTLTYINMYIYRCELKFFALSTLANNPSL